MRNDSHSVIMGIENVAIAPTEVTSDVLESINQHCRLCGHVERSSDMGVTRHIKYTYVDFLAPIVIKVNVRFCTSW